MSTLIALFIASSFVYDGVRDQVVALYSRVSPPSRRSPRATKYALFAIRKLPEWTPPPPLATITGPDGVPLLQSSSSVTSSLPAISLEAPLRHLAATIARAMSAQSGGENGAGTTMQAPAVAATTSAAAAQMDDAARAAAAVLETQLTAAAAAGSQLGRAAAVRLARAGDSLPFPAPSVRRRITGWAVDSLVVSMVASLFSGTGFRGSMAAILWMGRDLWLSPFNLPSPGRWLAGQTVLSVRIARSINDDFAPARDPGLVGADPRLASFLHHQHAAVVAHLEAARMHDADTYAVVSHNSLRLMLNSLGPLAALLWAGTTVGTVVGAPAGVWDGRTLWDRYTGVQIVDDEVLVSWAGTGVVLASGDAGTAVRALPASLMTSSSFAQSSGIAAADDMLEDDPPSPGFPAGGPAEMFVPPSSYFGGRGSAAAASVAAASAAAGANGANGSRDLLDANDDDLEYDDVSPPPAAPVRDSFFGGRSAVMVGDEDEDDGPEPVYYPFPAGGPSA